MASNWMDTLRRLSVRLAGVVSRAVVKRVDDSKKRQIVQAGLLEGETREGLEHYQPYGFTSVPHAGAEGVALFAGGERDHGLLVAVDDRRYRLTGLENGEVALYTDEGDKPSGEGDVIYSPRGCWHGFNNTSDEDVVLVWGWMGAGSIEDSGYEVDPASHA